MSQRGIRGKLPGLQSPDGQLQDLAHFTTLHGQLDNGEVACAKLSSESDADSQALQDAPLAPQTGASPRLPAWVTQTCLSMQEVWKRVTLSFH